MDPADPAFPECEVPRPRYRRGRTAYRGGSRSEAGRRVAAAAAATTTIGHVFRSPPAVESVRIINEGERAGAIVDAPAALRSISVIRAPEGAAHAQ